MTAITGSEEIDQQCVDQLTTSMAEGGTNVMLVSTPTGLRYVALDSGGGLVAVDPTLVRFGEGGGMEYVGGTSGTV